jgi:hypothetical protein
VHGLYLEGAHWDKQRQCLARSQPRVLIEELPMLLIIPTEVHRLRLQVGNTATPLLYLLSIFSLFFLRNAFLCIQTIS